MAGEGKGGRRRGRLERKHMVKDSKGKVFLRKNTKPLQGEIEGGHQGGKHPTIDSFVVPNLPFSIQRKHKSHPENQKNNPPRM